MHWTKRCALETQKNPRLYRDLSSELGLTIPLSMYVYSFGVSEQLQRRLSSLCSFYCFVYMSRVARENKSKDGQQLQPCYSLATRLEVQGLRLF